MKTIVNTDTQLSRILRLTKYNQTIVDSIQQINDMLDPKLDCLGLGIKTLLMLNDMHETSIILTKSLKDCVDCIKENQASEC
jgi:hypothetical protein